MKIIIAIDKFKGSATSAQLSHTIEQTIKDHLPNAQVVTIPVADGGDGTTQALKIALGSKVDSMHAIVSAPLQSMQAIEAEYLIDRSSHTAYMDLATASGISLIPLHMRDAMNASTRGTGEMIMDAIDNGVQNIVLGLGGSATTDGGTGLLSALGIKFLDNNNNIIEPCGSNLIDIATLDLSTVKNSVRNTTFTLLTDVDNQLLGESGAAAVYAPQKGATESQVRLLEKGLANLANFMPVNVPSTPGSGAAGGTAAGMIAFLNANIKPGASTLLEILHFDDLLADANFVITGEGRIDSQTMMGKAPAVIAKSAASQNIPTIALCGSLENNLDTISMGFSQVIAVTPHDIPLQQAMDTTLTLKNVRIAISKLIKSWE